jgi:hypothetical protein
MRVFRTGELTDSDWKNLAGTPLGIQMLHNAIYIEDAQTFGDDAVEEIGRFMATDVRGLWHGEVASRDDAASLTVRVAFEHEEERDSVATWLKMKFEGTAGADD